MMRFDPEYNVQDFTFVLSLKNHEHLGALRNVEPTSVTWRACMNAANELSFTVYKYNQFEISKFKEGGVMSDEDLDVFKEPLWDEIVDFKLIYVVELEEYYEIKVDKNDAESLYKTITATSACETELSQSLVYNVEINTELDIARTDYVDPTVFYKPEKPECSLLHRLLYKLPQYSIGWVDESLKNIQRTFSFDSTDVYSALTTNIAEEIGCLFVFDSVNRRISAYDLYTRCSACGHRGEFSDACPECGSTALTTYGEDTTIYVDSENLAENITLTVDTDQIKNCFKLQAGDDNMTAAIVNLNPNGSDYIYYFSDEQKKDMPERLVARLEEYDAEVAKWTPEYEEETAKMYEAIDKIIYYTSGMMPKQENDPTNAKLEAAKLTQEEMSPMGVTEVTKSTSTATVNTALKNYAKVFVKSGYFKIEINQGEFAYEGTDKDGLNYGYWYGNFKITNYSDEEDVATSELIKIKVCDDFETYMVQKIKKKLALEDEDGSIFDVLSIEDLAKFKEALTYYGLNRLKSFYDALEGCIDIMIEMEQGHENADMYDSMYTPYYNKLKACQQEIDKRQATVNQWGDALDAAEKRRKEIQKILDFEAYLGEELHKVFCMYKREDKYQNENYISDGFENDEVFRRAKEFLEAAKTELVKSGEHQRRLSATLANLLCMEEFIPIADKFELGNFIRVGIDGEVYKLRLLEYQVSFGDIQNIDVEFSDVNKVRNGVSDIQSVLSSAQSMASSYGGVMHQVKASKKETDKTKDWSESGLPASEVKIVNSADNQDVVFKDSGILVRRKDEFTEAYDDHQLKILNSGIYITNNNWASVEAALGRFYIQDEQGNEYTQMGLNASTIIGELLIGKQLRLYSNDSSKEMSFDDQGLILNSKPGENGYSQIFAIEKDGVPQMYIDTDGNLVFANPQTAETQGNIELVEMAVDSLKSRMNVAEKNINTINGNISNINSSIVNINDSIADIDSSIVDINKDIDNIDSSIVNINKDIDNAETNISNIVNVLSGKAGTAPLVKMTINSTNANIANGLIVDAMVSDNAAIQSTKIKYDNTTVAATLGEHSSNIASANASIISLQQQINNLINNGGGGTGGNTGDVTGTVYAGDVVYTDGDQASNVQAALDSQKELIANHGAQINTLNEKMQNAVLSQELITIAEIDAICSM